VSEPLPPGAAPEGGIAAVVVLAAGQGTRMRSSTPKVLHALGGRSMLGHVLAATAPLAPRHTLVVVGAGREAVEEHLAQVAPDARPVVQEEQRGSGHAAAVALAAVPDLQGPVLLVNGDAPLLRPETVTAVVDAHRAAGNVLTVLTAEVDDPTGLGRIVRDADGAVRAIVEQRDAGRWLPWASTTTRVSRTSPTSSACSSPRAPRSAEPPPRTRSTCWAATTAASSPPAGAPSTTACSTT
jgi:bifunctional UDP-N-acetylglucosamine pyrophosphorylase/glucosamine-1-phosphate N-acetyltransferase